MNHTPGPWEVSPSDPCRVNVKTGLLLHPFEPRTANGNEVDDDEFHDDWNICQADNDHYSRPHDECVANALLISLAPDLLTVVQLITLAPLTYGTDVPNEIMSLAKKALGQMDPTKPMPRVD